MGCCTHRWMPNQMKNNMFPIRQVDDLFNIRIPGERSQPLCVASSVPFFFLPPIYLKNKYIWISFSFEFLFGFFLKYRDARARAGSISYRWHRTTIQIDAIVFCFLLPRRKMLSIYFDWFDWGRNDGDHRRWQEKKRQKEMKSRREQAVWRGQTRPVLQTHRPVGRRRRKKENRAILVDFYDHAAVAPTNEYVSFRLAHGRRPGIAWTVYVLCVFGCGMCAVHDLFSRCARRFASVCVPYLVLTSSIILPSFAISRFRPFFYISGFRSNLWTLDFSWFSGYIQLEWKRENKIPNKRRRNKSQREKESRMSSSHQPWQQLDARFSPDGGGQQKHGLVCVWGGQHTHTHGAIAATVFVDVAPGGCLRRADDNLFPGCWFNSHSTGRLLSLLSLYSYHHYAACRLITLSTIRLESEYVFYLFFFFLTNSSSFFTA